MQLSGWKTYLVAAIAAATAGAAALGYSIPEWVYALQAAIGAATLRAAVTTEAGKAVDKARRRL